MSRESRSRKSPSTPTDAIDRRLRRAPSLAPPSLPSPSPPRADARASGGGVFRVAFRAQISVASLRRGRLGAHRLQALLIARGGAQKAVADGSTTNRTHQRLALSFECDERGGARGKFQRRRRLREFRRESQVAKLKLGTNAEGHLTVLEQQETREGGGVRGWDAGSERNLNLRRGERGELRGGGGGVDAELLARSGDARLGSRGRRGARGRGRDQRLRRLSSRRRRSRR